MSDKTHATRSEFSFSLIKVCLLIFCCSLRRIRGSFSLLVALLRKQFFISHDFAEKKNKTKQKKRRVDAKTRNESDLESLNSVMLLSQNSHAAVSECVYLSSNRFSMAMENGIQISFSFFGFFSRLVKRNSISIPFFVFRLPVTLKNGFDFRFSFLFFHFRLTFEKRI